MLDSFRVFGEKRFIGVLRALALPQWYWRKLGTSDAGIKAFGSPLNALARARNFELQNKSMYVIEGFNATGFEMIYKCRRGFQGKNLGRVKCIVRLNREQENNFTKCVENKNLGKVQWQEVRREKKNKAASSLNEELLRTESYAGLNCLGGASDRSSDL